MMKVTCKRCGKCAKLYVGNRGHFEVWEKLGNVELVLQTCRGRVINRGKVIVLTKL